MFRKRLLVAGALLTLAFPSLATTDENLKHLVRSHIGSDSGFSFITQFQGTDTYQAIKNKNYNIDKWSELAKKGDILAIEMLLRLYLSNNDYDRALDYAWMSYAYSEDSFTPLTTLEGIYDQQGDDLSVAVISYMLGNVIPSMKEEDRYQSMLSQYSADYLKKQADLMVKLNTRHYSGPKQSYQWTKPVNVKLTRDQ